MQYLLTFVSFCHFQLELSRSTIRTYLAGIQHYFSLQDPNRPSFFQRIPSGPFLKGFRRMALLPRLADFPSRGIYFGACPIYLPGLLRAVTWLGSQGGQVSGFMVFLRPGEFTYAGTRSRILLINQLVRFPDHFQLLLDACKKQQIGAGTDIRFLSPVCLGSGHSLRPTHGGNSGQT